MSFSRIDAGDFVVSADSVVAPAWSSNLTVLSSFYTAPAISTGSYYIDVYNADPSVATASVQFSIAYGRKDGSGSTAINPLVDGNSPTRITYSQYKNIVYGDPELYVNFGGVNTDSPDLIAIQVDRNRYKEALFLSTFNLYLSGSGGLVKLTNNSNDVSVVTYLDCGRAYDIISGSAGTATNTPTVLGASQKGYTVSGSYGLFLPDVGLILLNPRALGLPAASGGINLDLVSGSSSNSDQGSSQNHYTLFTAINKGGYFALNSQETISSNYVFVRVRNQEYNYSTNPSVFLSGSDGTFIYSNFINSPQTFPTTVGMYNDNNELLAVAKLSKPLTKDFTKEALIRVKLDW